MKDAWRMFRLATKNKKQKAKTVINDKKSSDDKEDVDYAREEETSTRAVLAIMEEIADFHERFANLIHWRDPEASRRYAIILAFMIFLPFVAPAKYVIKGTYAVGGIAFWFVPNIWAALPVEHRSRIPPPLGDVPTDAEYAMNIISQRVDRGEAVLPSELRRKEKRQGSTNLGVSRSTYSITPSATFSSMNKSNSTLGMPGDEVDGDTVSVDGNPEKSTVKRFKTKMKNVVLADQRKRSETHDESGELLPEETFPAKYHAAMGMITLTPVALSFYPMMSSTAKVSIPLSDIRGVKKAGRMGGLRIKYTVRDEASTLSGSPRRSMDDNSSVNNTGGILERITTATKPEAPTISMAINGEPLEKEEKFGWISGRDELFAKLVGWGGRRWVKM
ncbi:hypothetical protein FRC20_011807 [Serendipita sp. 405]|nr:hypothetical protein FRC20_011807 [Serendipita sp. 405]